MNIRQLFRKYPLTMLCIVLIWYLCLIKSPSLRLYTFSGFDKVVHAVMYLGLCGVFWAEYVHSRWRLSRGRLLLLGVAAPVLMSGLVELAQEYLTDSRTGDWADFAANSVGVAVAALGALAWRQWKHRR